MKIADVFEERDSSEEDISSTSESEEEEVVEFKPKGDNSNRTKQTAIGDDSSEEWPEGITRNTVGNIPLEWYDDYDHIGYDIEGNKILKSQRKDEIEDFLAKTDDPNYWKTIYDAVNDRDVILTDKQIEILRRIQKGQLGVESNPNDYLLPLEDNKDWFHPASNAPPPKSRFLPSKWEAKRIAYLVKAMRKGWIKLPEDEKAEREKKKEKKFYNLWQDDEELTKEQKKRKKMHIEAPRMKMPTHAESYNPPVEYLMTEEGIKKWQEAHPEDRKRNFIPHKYSSMREVPRYTNDIKERFERCLDLYLCPREVKARRKIKPEKLLPQVPKPQDLRPFPTRLGVVYEGHTERVRSISASPTGEYMVSGSEDNTIKIWEVETGRCLETHKLEGVVQCVAWNPNPDFSLIAVAVDRVIIIITPLLSSKRVKDITDSIFKERSSDQKWLRPSQEDWETGKRSTVNVDALTSVLKWHSKGDYLVSVAPKSASGSVMIHRVTQQKTQVPFKKDSGLIQSACFHPRKPIFFVATQRYVKVYNLQKQKLIKKLSSGAKWISSIDVHPEGDNVLIGSYDSKVCWFDLDLSKRPYKTLRYHKMAVRNVIYHQKYPLFATCSDDGVAHVFHNTVYDDLLKNPLIVPVKILRGHKVVDNLGVIDCKWHPHQPWLFTAGSDNKILLFTT